MQRRPRRALDEQLSTPAPSDPCDERRDRVEQHDVVTEAAPSGGDLTQILEHRLLIGRLGSQQRLMHIGWEPGRTTHLQLLARESIEVLRDEGRVERMLGRARLHQHLSRERRAPGAAGCEGCSK